VAIGEAPDERSKEKERKKGKKGWMRRRRWRRRGSRKPIGVKSVNEVCCETVREARYGFANSVVRDDKARWGQVDMVKPGRKNKM